MLAAVLAIDRELQLGCLLFGGLCVLLCVWRTLNRRFLAFLLIFLSGWRLCPALGRGGTSTTTN